MLEPNKDIIIIPDVHGRTFWKEATARFPEGEFVFLGNYLDPYYIDEILNHITSESALNNFREILAFAKDNPGRVTLLLGNHDCEYLYGRNVCDCRCDDDRYDIIRKLFRDNKDLFEMAAEALLGKKHFVFVHAGISIEWMDRHVEGWTPDNLVGRLNTLNREALSSERPEDSPFASALSERDRERSGDLDYASPIWIDAETLNRGYQLCDIYQVVGHSAIRYMEPVITSRVFYTDCMKALRLDEDGVLRNLDGKRCVNRDKNPFAPMANGYDCHLFGGDAFSRPYCRTCGSHNIYIRGGVMADHWYCRDCGIDEVI